MRLTLAILVILLLSSFCNAQEVFDKKFWVGWSASKVVYYIGSGYDYKTSVKFDGKHIIEGNKFFQNSDLTFNGSRYILASAVTELALDGILLYVVKYTKSPRWLKLSFAYGNIGLRTARGINRYNYAKSNEKLIKLYQQ